MKIVLCVASKRERIPDSLLRRIEEVASRTLPFCRMPYNTATLLSPSKRTLMVVWSNDTSLDGNRLITTGHGGALADTGDFRLGQARDRQWLVNELSRSANPDDAVATLGGVFTLYYLDAANDRIRAWNTPTRMANVFWTQESEYAMLGDRALLLSMLRGDHRAPTYRLENFVPFVNQGYFANESTPYEGVEVLPVNSSLCVRNGVVSSHLIDDGEFNREYGESPPDSRFYDEITAVFFESLEPLKTTDAPWRIGLTGGKDSRVLAAAMRAADVPLVAYTRTPFADPKAPVHPEVVVARQVAKALGIPHETVPRAIPSDLGTITVDPFANACETLFTCDAMLYAYMHKNLPRGYARGRLISGLGGELLRGGYSNLKRPDLTREQMTQALERKYLKHSPFIRPEYVGSYRSYLKSWIDEACAQVSPPDAFDKFYKDYHFGRWAAASRAGDAINQATSIPLCDAVLIRQSRRVATRYRINESILYNIVERIAPEILRIPFFNDHWKCGPKHLRQTGHVDHERYKSRYFNWKEFYGTDLKETFVEQIFHNAASDSLFDLLDRKAMTDLFASERIFTRDVFKFVWSAYTISVMLTNRWLDPPAEQRPIQIRYNQPWHKASNRILVALRKSRDRVPQQAAHDCPRVARPLAALRGLSARTTGRRGGAPTSFIPAERELEIKCVADYLGRIQLQVNQIKESLPMQERDWQAFLDNIVINTGNDTDDDESNGRKSCRFGWALGHPNQAAETLFGKNVETETGAVIAWQVIDDVERAVRLAFNLQV